jgi:DUF1009 family protein
MFGIKGWADAAMIGRYVHHWIALGQAGRFLRLAKAENCGEVLFIGTVLRPPLSALRLDWHTIKLMPRVIRFFRGGDDKLLSGVAGVAESGGLRVVGVKDVAPELFVPEGVLGTQRPSARDYGDIGHALKLIATLGPFDVGQAAVVADGHVIAVEAAEGTDHMLARIAELRRLGRVSTPPGVGVLVKAPKPGQDRRFDLPSIGPRTIELVAGAGLAGLAVTAGSTMIAEAEAAIAAADRERIFVVGVREPGPGAGAQ